MSHVPYTFSGTAYTITPINPRVLKEIRDKAAEHFKRPVFMGDRPDIERPHRPCKTCKGTGVSSHTGPNAGSCAECRGLKTTEMTEPEIREAYRLVRNATVRAIGSTKEGFDELVRLYLPSSKTPAQWLYWARHVYRQTREGKR